MKQIALKYGIIGGLLMSIPMFIIIPLIDSIGFENGTTILFVSMMLSFIAIYLGINSVRKNVGGGYIGFRSAFITGLVITVIMSVIYTAAFMLEINVFSPAFADKYDAYILTQMKTLHATQADIDKFTADAAIRHASRNLFVNAAMQIMKPLLFGGFFTFSSSLILRKKEFTAANKLN
jgi:hypothetical protein